MISIMLSYLYGLHGTHTLDSLVHKFGLVLIFLGCIAPLCDPMEDGVISLSEPIIAILHALQSLITDSCDAEYYMSLVEECGGQLMQFMCMVTLAIKFHLSL